MSMVRSFLQSRMRNIIAHRDVQDDFAVMPMDAKLFNDNDFWARLITGEPDDIAEPLAELFHSDDDAVIWGSLPVDMTLAEAKAKLFGGLQEGLDSGALEQVFREIFQEQFEAQTPPDKTQLETFKAEMHGRAFRGLNPALVADVNRHAVQYREEQLMAIKEEWHGKAFNGLDQSLIDGVRYEVAEHEEQLAEFKGDKAFRALDQSLVAGANRAVAEHELQELQKFKEAMHGKAFQSLHGGMVQGVKDEVRQHVQQTVLG
mmetsp:Transcript_16833/g.44290  ORF Transcript_16833/g.44290 Transcript_16833/m.44290 type:complete len:260 (+) Transcript_16833:73-852(+)